MRLRELIARGPTKIELYKMGVKNRLQKDLDSYEAGILSVRKFETRLKKRLAKAYEDSYAMGSGGYLDEDYIQKQLEKEYGFLRGMFKDIQQETDTMPLSARLSMYGDKVSSIYWSGRVREKGSGKDIRWNLGPSDKNCDDCIELAGNTYTAETLPTYPGAGDTRCLTRCQCYLTFE